MWILLLFVGPPAAILCVTSLLGIWLAFGRAHVLIRMPAFLLGTLPIGLGLCIAEATADAGTTTPFPNWDGWLLFAIMKYQSDSLQLYVLGGLFVAVSFLLARTHWVLQLPTFVCGALMLAAVAFGSDFENLRSEWIVRVTLATTLIGSLVGVLRWFGFNVVRLTDGVGNEEMEKGTGRDLDEWISILNAARGESLNRAELMACLRRYGFSFAWQRTIAIAYEKALGRRAVGQSVQGKSQVVLHDPSSLAALVNRLTRQQFSIWQLMLLTFAVASVLGFCQLFTWFPLTLQDLKFGLPLAIGVAAIAVSVLWGCLAMRRKLLIACVLVFVTAGAVAVSLGMVTNSILQFLVFSTLVAFAAQLMLTLILVRHRGFRLVRVQLR